MIGCRKLEKNNLIGCWIIRKNNLAGCRMIRKNEFDCLRNIRKRGSERNCRNNRNWRDWFQEYYYVIGCRNIRKRMRLVAGTSAWFREGRREARTRSSPTLHCRQVGRNHVVVVVYSVGTTAWRLHPQTHLRQGRMVKTTTTTTTTTTTIGCLR